MSVALTVGTARVITGMLGLLAELPSTPSVVGPGLQHYIAAIEQQLPTPHHRQAWDVEGPPADTIILERGSAEAVAELLELFAQMPSTPPVVATEARGQAAEIWKQLSSSDPAQNSNR